MEKEKESTVSLVTLLEKVTEVTTATPQPATGPQDTGPVTIKLIMNEREFARATVKTLNKEQRVRVNT